MSAFNPGNKVGKYIFIQQIGSGAFAQVWLAYHELTKMRVAIKIVNKQSLESVDSQTRFQREVSLLKQLTHPFIAEFFEFLEDEKYYYLVIEYVENGNMLDFINNHGRISEPQARRYFSQIICVLEYLHKEKFVAHRDLKAENVLLDKYGNIRIIDFGLSNVFSQQNPKLNTACGSPAYAAPEMIKGQPYTNAADIWSSGILLFSMVAGQLPYDDTNTQRLLQKIIYTDLHFPPFMSQPLVDLLKKILCKDPENRISIDGIKEHVWFSQSEYISLLQLRLKESTHLPISIDKEIVDKINKYGVDTRSLYQSILTNEFNELTAIYRQLTKQKSTEQMKDLMQKLQTNAPVQQGSNLKFSFNFNSPIPQTMKVSFTNMNNAQRRQSLTEKQQTMNDFMRQNSPSPGLVNNPQNNVINNDINNANKGGLRVMQVPAPVQIAARRLSRPVAVKRTIDLPQSPRKPP
ncbi:CAMK family protein kinase [Tritrichomonas foetus]|uniref:non-specific serine/threonine protein kinase n=1 Tax=Tritrichomonas foetus TaxID=1144522 RepID=A0A1J4KQY1_9EUKA|nr:CAMK family protein kinase [Tritrichomonas foetus]|eukprot:OHT13671.1 CAMK family protein kinase [Tritrichomonas foetus]